tara:strand:- start:497 stop:916 length:420 start_codon:yes stop_codon:yes gene_type:complete
MNNEKDKYEIVRSFQNLLKKAEQLSHEKKADKLLEKNRILSSKIDKSNKTNNKFNIQEDAINNRLGIKNIKRLPHYPFKNKKKIKGEEYEINKKELTIKVTNILNKHISFWLIREMPKFVKIKLRKNIYNLLMNINKIK